VATSRLSVLTVIEHMFLARRRRRTVFSSRSRVSAPEHRELDQQSVSVSKVSYFPGQTRGQESVWTVSPSSNRITRRYRFSISELISADSAISLANFAQRRPNGPLNPRVLDDARQGAADGVK